MAIGAIVGTAVSVYSDLQTSGAKARAESEVQNSLNLQAGEMERRGNIDRMLTQREGEQFIDRQSVAFSGNGVDVSSSVGALDFLAFQHRQLSSQIELKRQQVEFDAAQTRAGILASERRAAAYGDQATAKGAGSILQLGGSLYNTYGGSKVSATRGTSTGALSTGAPITNGVGSYNA